MGERENNFGKTEIVGSAKLKLDSKGRIALPSFTHATPEDKIALMYDLKRTKIIIEEYKKFEEHLDIITNVIDELFRKKTIDYTEYHRLRLFIYGDGCLEPPTIVKSGRRITIPARAIGKLNLKDEVYVIGDTVKINYQETELVLHRLEIYPSEESYTLSKKNV